MANRSGDKRFALAEGGELESDASDGSLTSDALMSVDGAAFQSDLGYEQWCNSKDFSDLTIRYGEQGEKVFYGHRVILSSHVRWFKHGLLGAFKEATEKEITLCEDDPVALHAMLSYCYIGSKVVPWRAPGGSSLRLTNYEEILYIINLFEVADKYDCPSLQDDASQIFTRCLSDYMFDLRGKDRTEQLQLAEKELLTIVTKVYDLSAGRTWEQLDILHTLIQEARKMSGACRGRESEGSIGHVLHILCKKHVEFGRDMLLELLGDSLDPCSPTDITVRHQVQCPKCNFKWMLPMSEESGWSKGCCWACGVYQDDWVHYRVWNHAS